MNKIANGLAILLVIVFLMCLTILQVLGQPVIQWQKCLGGTKMDNGYSIKPTYDGGYISAGEALSNDGDVNGHHGSTDTLDSWVVKTDATGNIQWQKSFGGSGSDWSASIIQTTDSNFVFVGTTYSNDGDVTANNGISDVWVVKLDEAGNIQWQKSFGGTGFDFGSSITQTIDGGFMIGAITNSNDGDVIGNHGGADLWLLKLDAAGNLQWQKCLGGTGNDGINGGGYTNFFIPDVSVIQTTDNGYFAAVSSCSSDGDITSHHGSAGVNNSDYLVVKLDNTGVILWQQSLGGTGIDVISKALQTTDGGYIIAGYTLSKDGDVIGQHVNGLGNSWDMWIVKTDSIGAIQWTKTLGGFGLEKAYAICATSDGGYFVSANCGSPNNGDVAGRRGGTSDVWIVKLNVAGVLQWQKCLGGSGSEYAFSGIQTSDGGYLVEGFTSSNNNDVTGNHSSGTNTAFGVYNDLWMIKLSPVSDNVIRGNVYEDSNADCLKDSAEVGLKGRIVKAMPGNYYASTDVLGNYALFVDSGIYTVSYTPPQYYNQSCPASSGTYNVTINAATPNSFGNDFADTLTSHCADLTVSIATSYLRACRKNSYIIQYKNTGAVDAINVTVTVNFPSQIIPLNSTIPWTVPYFFNLDTVRVGQIGFIGITDSLSCNSTLGDTLCVNANITSTTAECDITNNNSSDCHIVINACDPNGLEVQSQNQNSGYVTQENISHTDSLTYLIRFQNIGNDTAFTVIVRDTLSNYLDAATIQSIAASHAYTFRIYGQGICEWTFNNILLPDSATNELLSQGFIKFTVLQTPGNTIGTTIPNTAAIWFDYNQYIATNNTFNFIQSVSSVQSILQSNVLAIIYPNPFTTSATLAINKNLKNAELIIFNVFGEGVRRVKNIYSNKIPIERGKLCNGIYGYKVVQDNCTVANGKFIVE